MTKLLIDEPPLQVLPTLAKLLGLLQAIVLQQIHWLALREGVERDGRRWLSGNLDQLRAQFPWCSERTFRRSIEKLVKRGVLIVEQQSGFSRVNSYAVDLAAIDAANNAMRPKWPDGSGQSGRIDAAKVDACSSLENTKPENIAPPPEPAPGAPAKVKYSASSEEAGGFVPNTPEHVAARLCSIVDRLMADGRPISSGRTRAALVKGVRDALAKPGLEVAVTGRAFTAAHLLAALDRMAREPYWATQMLAMAQWTRPSIWLRMYNDYLRLTKPLPRASAPAAPLIELLPDDPYGGAA